MKNVFKGEGAANEFEYIAPRLARQDYYSDMAGVSFFLQLNPSMTQKEFEELLKKNNFQEIPTFSQKYADQKNILDNQPDGLVERLDALALEVAQHCKDGTLTIEMYEKLAEQMKVLCGQG